MCISFRTIKIFIFMVVFLVGCQALPTMPTAFVTSRAPTIFIPTITPRPTATVTPTEVSSVFQGTPVPVSQQSISPENAGKLMKLSRWGKGIPQRMVWQGDGQGLMIASTGGLAFFDANNLTETRFIEMNRAAHQMAASPDGKMLALAFQDGALELWDMQGQVLFTFRKERSPVTNLLFSNDSNYLVINRTNGVLKIYSLTDPLSGQFAVNNYADLKGLGKAVSAMGFNLDQDNFFAWDGKQKIIVWKIPQPTVRRNLVVNNDQNGKAAQIGALSRTSKWFAASYGNYIRIQRTTDGVTMGSLYGFTEPIEAMAFSPDQKLLVTTQRSTIQVWTVPEGALVKSYALNGSSSGLKLFGFAPDGKSFAYYTDALRVWRMDADTPVETQPAGYVSSLRSDFSFQSETGLLTTAYLDGSVRSFSLPAGEMRSVVQTGAGNAKGMAFSPDASRLASGSGQTTLNLWQTMDGTHLAVLEGFRYLQSGMAFSKDGQYLAVPSLDKVVVIFRLSDSGVVAAISTPEPVWSVTFSPDGSLVAARSNSKIYVFQVADGQLRYSLDGYSMAFSPDGSNLVVAFGIFDAIRLRIYQSSDGLMLREFEADGGAMTYSPDGRLLAISNDHLDIRQVSDGKLMVSLSNPAPYIPLLFSSDGRLLAVAAWDGRIYLWGVP
jgi:WD40 repeat protein